MTTVVHPPTIVHEIEDELPADPLAFRRIWPKVRGPQAASTLVLKAYGVLYDAEYPLTRAELVEALLPQLDPYDKAYLQAWDLRFRGGVFHRDAKKRGRTLATFAAVPAKIAEATNRWVGHIFLHRQYGGTLIRDSNGRYRPGPRAPRMLTTEGMVPFTPETRKEQEVLDQSASQQAAMDMEWQRVMPLLNNIASEDRLLVLAFLARRYSGRTKTPKNKAVVSETGLRSICHHLLKADRPGVRPAILRWVLDWATAPDLKG